MVRFFAEVSSNHNQDLKRCKQFISCAKRIGCDAVKFQLFKIDQLFSPEVLKRSETHRDRKNWELPDSYLPVLAQHAKKEKIEFWLTPFDLDAVKVATDHVAGFKIGSYELLWDDLLVACAESQKPIILSTGMADLEEVKHAVMVLQENNCRTLTVLHCVSRYPTPFLEANLSAMETLSKTLDVPIGWSDHTVSPAVLYRAIHKYNAQVVEFHLDLDGEGDEFKAGHCWLPDQIQAVIGAVQTGIKADGSGIKMALSEEARERDWRADPKDGLRPLKHLRRTWRP